jgi:hypothetical protein
VRSGKGNGIGFAVDLFAALGQIVLQFPEAAKLLQEILGKMILN